MKFSINIYNEKVEKEIRWELRTLYPKSSNSACRVEVHCSICTELTLTKGKGSKIGNSNRARMINGLKHI